MNGLWGTYSSALDSKGRISIPVKVRNNLLPEDDSTFMLLRGKGKYIVMRPLSRFERYMDSIESKVGDGAKFEIYSRHLLRDASLQKLDKQGRINLTKKLIDYAELDGEVQIHTYRDRLEIWKEENYNEYIESTSPVAEEIAQEHDV